MRLKNITLWSAGLVTLLGVSLEEAHAKISKTVPLQTTGSTSLEQIKEQTSQLSYALRQNNTLLEGKIEAPGIHEFSSYFNQKDDNSKDSLNDNIEKLRSSTITSIEKLLKRSHPAQRADLLLRLAELYSERHIFFLKKEMDSYENAYEKWKQNKGVGPEPKFIQNQSLQSLATATQILRSYVNQYPNQPRTPDALYQLGFLLTEMRSESALLYFQRLIERFPQSKHIPDAHLALGEFFFSKNKFSEALQHYQKVLNHRENRSYPYAVYKLGWTFFNIRGTEQETSKNLNKSLIAFKLLVKFANESSKEKKLEILKKDALRDMVLVFAEIGNIDEAQSYFKSIREPELYNSLLERLAWLHTESGRNREAIDIYTKLIEEFPLSLKNPSFLIRIAGLQEKEQRREKLIESLTKASEMMEANSAWSRSQKRFQDKEENKSNLLKEINIWNVRLHAEFQKTKNKKTALESLQLYDLSLQLQHDTATQYLTHFNRAQLLTSLGEHDKAIDGYINSAILDKKFNLKKNESKIGLENAMAESEILLTARGALTHKSPQLPPLEARYIRIIDMHSSLFPKDPERLANQHRAALMLFQAHQFPLASQRWISLAKEFPESPQVNEGLRLFIKKSFDAQDWVRAWEDTKTFLAIPRITQAQVGQHLIKLQKVAQFQHGLVLEKNGRHLDAAQLFTDFQKSYPSDQDAPKALINAANNEFKALRPDTALSTLEDFVRLYPSSELKTKALEMIATTAEGMGRFADAALALEQLALRSSQNELGAQRQVRAAQLRLASGNSQLSANNIQTALPLLKRGNDICEAYKTLIDAQSLSNPSHMVETAKSATQKCQTASPEWGIFFSGLASHLSLKNRDLQEASRLSMLSLARGKMLKGKLQSPFAFEGLRLAGSVQLELLESKSKQLSQKRISDPNKIHQEFNIIKTEAQTLAQQFIQLAQSGQPETSVGALYRVAEIQEALSVILLQVPNPNGAPAGEQEFFRTKLEKIALPLQEEAAELYAQALEKSHEVEAMTSYTNLLKEKLSQIRPGEYRKAIENIAGPSPVYVEDPKLISRKD